MKTANEKTWDLQSRLERQGIKATFEQAETLRRAELALQRWSEYECGNGNDYSSWAIERDEVTGTPYMVIYPHKGETRRYKVADKEKGALKRIEAICKELGIYFYHQGDPRGCALYVSKEPLPDNNYTRGVACCA